MKIGIFGINQGALANNPALLGEVAKAAEDLGYESVWTGEHMVLPSPRVAPSPAEPTDPLLDPMPALTWAGAFTSKILLGTGILLLPQRNPVALAKEVASVDVLTGGRFLLGIGVGYLEPEFKAVGVPMEHRGKRADEYLAAMQALWGMDAPAYHGEFVSFEGVDAYPRPTRREGPPIIMGGHSDAAYRRAVRTADEWYGFAIDVERTKAAIAELKTAQDKYGLGRAKGRLPITITPPMAATPEVVSAYAEAGVDRLNLLTRGTRDRDTYLRFLEANAPAKLVR
jgi:probable F420-dependent oxidoreductase